MSKEEHDIDTLVDTLSNELSAVEPMPHPLMRVLPWFCGAVLYITFAILVLGFRPDFFDKVIQISYMAELTLLVFISMSAAFCSLWLTVPDMRGAKWMLYIPVVAFSAFLVWHGIRMGMEEYVIPHMRFHPCHIEAFIFGVLPAIALLFLSSKGNTTHPILLSFMNILAVGSLGYTGLRITCVSDDIGHLFADHFLPYILLGIVVTFVGRRIYRW
ncbi:MAG: NrsF family protein [Alphaproteobacteria bacterium]